MTNSCRSMACLALTAACLLAACSSTEWVHPHKKKEQLVYDYNKCERDLLYAQTTTNMIQVTPYVQKSLIDKCLKKNGWVEVDKEE